MPEIDTKSLESRYGEFAQTFSSEIIRLTEFRQDWCLEVKPALLLDMLVFLKEDEATAFSVLMDLFGVDYLKFPDQVPERFAVIYNLYSLSRSDRLQLKVWVKESRPEVDSAVAIYAAANWFEREVWDMYGIVFRGHPNLVRILCHHEFVGHPLRKDYPSDQYQRLRGAAPSTDF